MKKDIWEIVAASLRGEELAESEKKELQEWLSEGEGHRRDYAVLGEFARKPEAREKVMDLGMEEAWGRNQRLLKRRRKQRLLKMAWRAGCAAMVVVAVGIGGWWWREVTMPEEEVSVAETGIVPGTAKAVLTLASGEKVALQEGVEWRAPDSTGGRNVNNRLEYAGNEEKREVEKRAEELVYNVLTIPRGGEYQLRLADGTLVWLNSETRLRYPVEFGEKVRKVFLDGEAYFEVAKDAGRPFTVCVEGGVEVTALGTQFNVSAVRGRDAVYTTLVEGSAKVENEAGGECILDVSQQAVCQEGEKEIGVQRVNTALYTAWRDGYYAFDKEPLEDMLETLARWYDVEVFFAHQETGKLRFSGRVKRYEEISNLLTMIKLTNDVDFEIKGRTITVTCKKCRK